MGNRHEGSGLAINLIFLHKIKIFVYNNESKPLKKHKLEDCIGKQNETCRLRFVHEVNAKLYCESDSNCSGLIKHDKFRSANVDNT